MLSQNMETNGRGHLFGSFIVLFCVCFKTQFYKGVVICDIFFFHNSNNYICKHSVVLLFSLQKFTQRKKDRDIETCIDIPTVRHIL